MIFKSQPQYKGAYRAT